MEAILALIGTVPVGFEYLEYIIKAYIFLVILGGIMDMLSALINTMMSTFGR